MRVLVFRTWYRASNQCIASSKRATADLPAALQGAHLLC